MVGVGVGGLNVNVGRLDGVGAAEVAGCDGDGCALDRVGDGTGVGGAALLLLAVAIALVVGCAPMGSPPAGPVLPGSAAAVALDVWLACPDLADAAEDAGGCAPVSAMAATIPVAAIAITTPATAAVIPDSASIRRRGGLTGSGKPLGRNDPARCVTSRR